MKILIFLSLLTIVVSLVNANYKSTPLDEFVFRPDVGVGDYYVNKTISGPNYTAYVLNFTSINWLTEKETSHPKWWHWLVVCVPDIVLSDYGYLEVDGLYFDTVVDELFGLISTMCSSSNSIISHLYQNPNQHVIFHNDGIPREEDGILAYTWNQFIQNKSNTDWLGQFALTKAVVRAMDTVQRFVESRYYFHQVNHFVVGGGSKRGWASWLTGAVDPLKAIIPVVFPNLNMVQNSINHYRAYGGWSFAYGDYFEQGLMKYLNTHHFDDIARLIDPIYFMERLRKIPKYIIQGVGDEYFLPDSATFFWPQLLGEKMLRIHPNTGHSLEGQEVNFFTEINSYYNLIINNLPRPEFDWSILPDPTTNQTTIHVTVKSSCTFQRPSSVVVWTADTLSTTQRDWRYSLCNRELGYCTYPNITWVSTPIEPVEADFYSYTVSAPVKGGWRGAFIELTYPSFFGPQRYTTDFIYAPYVFPFENCGLDCGNKKYPA
eukprot:gene3321-4163_t